MSRGSLPSMSVGAPLQRSYTAKQALRSNPAELWELVEGRVVVMSPAGARHAGMVANVTRLLSDFVRARRLGFVLAGDAGFILRRRPDTVRAPDVAFIRRARLPKGLPAAFIDGAPDLAVEVKSPDDRWPAIAKKAREFIAAGSVAVWALDPAKVTARVYTSRGERALATGGVLTCPALLGDFELRLRDLGP
jgi:Uma2 family endonuclease